MLQLYAIRIAYSTRLPEDTVVVPPDIQKQTGLQPGQQVRIRAGKRMAFIHIAGSTVHDSDTVWLAQNVRDTLLLPATNTLNLAVAPDSKDWRLGPLIGIFACRSGKSQKPFGEQSSFFTSLRRAAGKLNSFCFAFGPEDIDWKNETIRGSVPPENKNSGEWLTMRLPFPDVIYDRGLFPRGEKRRAATQARRALRNYPGVTMFNPAFFGKWKTHRLLAGNESLYSHLPDTRLYTDVTDIHALLKKHGTVYVKPSGGSSGRGILRIAASNGRYKINLREARKAKTIELTDCNELETTIKMMMANQRYIVQQGLNLANAEGSPFDIRVMMQRDRHGDWRRTGMALRVSAPGHYISNIHAGGHAEKVSAIMPETFPSAKYNKIIQDIRRICNQIACWVSSEGNPLFGEIAIDLGVDVSGKVWIIELNAIPGRSVFRRIGAVETLAKAIARPMEYAYFLSGFEPRNNK